MHNASCSFTLCLILGLTFKSISSCLCHHIGGVITWVNREGNAMFDGIDESDTKNEAKVITNDASPHCTDEYKEDFAAVAASCSDCIFSNFCYFCLHAL